MNYSLKSLTGIGLEERRQLSRAEIRTTDALLRRCADRRGRRAVSRVTGFSDTELLRWAKMADLMRVSGVGEEYCDLLEAAGVDTVRVLGTRRPENLRSKLAELNAERRVVRRTPSIAEVESWVEQSRSLEPMITR